MARVRKIKPWTSTELKMLKKLAGKSSAKRIARELKRSLTAVRVKASTRGLSLRVAA